MHLSPFGFRFEGLKLVVCVESSISLENGAGRGGKGRCFENGNRFLVVEFFLPFNIFCLSLYCSEE